MKSRNLIYLSSLFCIFAVYISAVEEKVDNTVQAQSMLAVLYAQSSAEFDANNIQTYAGAKLALDVALTKKNWTAAIEQKENAENVARDLTSQLLKAQDSSSRILVLERT